ncbi:hypothetical protein MNBD_GAMMA04-1657 [hydrothermal vent metagenome]|uniref:HIRAN domain-containing protein n=1 Tax=hydrothermal vent metagenome TaxID=652676 RepID=A0A3B0WK62_9ZZZZ
MIWHTVQFPIKGTYYYAADLALEYGWIAANTTLILKPEPDNPYDPNAIQIWCHNPNDISSDAPKLLIGYVPRALAKQLQPVFKADKNQIHPLHAQVIHRAKRGKQIEIDGQIQLSFSWRKQLKIQWICFWIRQQQRFTHFKNRFQNS